MNMFLVLCTSNAADTNVPPEMPRLLTKSMRNALSFARGPEITEKAFISQVVVYRLEVEFEYAKEDFQSDPQGNYQPNCPIIFIRWRDPAGKWLERVI